MKSYILLPSEPVQSQITTVAARTQASDLFVGLDVHNESIAVSLAPSDTTEVRRYGIIGGEHDDVFKLVKNHKSPITRPAPEFSHSLAHLLVPRHRRFLLC